MVDKGFQKQKIVLAFKDKIWYSLPILNQTGLDNKTEIVLAQG